MAAAIVNNRIAGTRITIWDVFYYLNLGHDPEYVTTVLPLTLEEVQAAMTYIEEHKAHVLMVHQQIEERNARGNPPEIEAKRAVSRAAMQAWLIQRRQAASQEKSGEGILADVNCEGQVRVLVRLLQEDFRLEFGTS